MKAHFKKPLTLRERQKKHRRMLIIRLILLAFLVGCFIFEIYYGTTQLFRYGNIEVVGNKTVNAEDVQRFAQQKLDQNFLSFIPRDNVFFSPASDIQATLKSEFPHISEVYVHSKVYLRQKPVLEVGIIERKPDGIWCKGNQSVENGSDCYYLDNSGFIYGNVDPIDDNAYLIFEGNILLNNPIGAQFLDEQSFASLRKFIDKLNTFLATYNMKGVRVMSSPGGEFELFLHGSTGVETSIKFTNKESFDSTLNNITMVLPNAEVRNSYYIDARFGNKIFYKPYGTSSATST